MPDCSLLPEILVSINSPSLSDAYQIYCGTLAIFLPSQILPFSWSWLQLRKPPSMSDFSTNLKPLDTQHLFSLTQIYSIWSRKSWSSLWIKVENIISDSFSEFFSFMTLTNFLTIFIVLISCWMSFVPVWITRTFGFFRMAVFT